MAKKRISIKVTGVVLVSTLVSSVSVRAEHLRLLNWEDYLSEEVSLLWEEQGHSIETILFDNDEKRDAILVNSKEGQIDVAVVDEMVGTSLGSEGRLLELNESNIPALKHLDSFWRQRCGKYAVPYLWGTLGIAYRSDVVSEVPKSWADLLKPAQDMKGHIGMMDDFTDMLAPALFMKGFSINTENESELKQAFELLKNQAEQVLTYEYPLTFLSNNPDAEQLYMALAYSGDQSSLDAKSGVDGLWRYTVPVEGSLLWVDCLAVNSESKNKELAFEFINFLSQPHISAKNSLALEMAVPSDAAKALLPVEFLADQEIYPKAPIIARSELYETLSRKNIKLRLRISSAVVNIYESSKAH